MSAGLNRSIGPGLLLLFVVGNILGAGVYAIVGEVAGESGGAIWAAFLAAAVLATFTCFSYIELATKYRRAGGAGLYLARAFGRPWLTLTVTIAVAASAITSAATSARAFAGEYLGTFASLPAVPVAIAFVAALTIVNFIGISESLKANVVMTLVIVAGLFLVVGVGVAALVSGDGEVGRLTETPDDVALPLAIAGGAGLAFFAFVGFEDTVQVAEETDDPARSFPIGLLGGLAITTVIYLLVACATAIVVAPDTLSDSTGPLVRVVEEGSAIPGEVIAGVALVALGNTALLQLVASSRLLYGIANRGLLPSRLATVHAGRQTPWFAIVVVGVVAAALAATGRLGGLADTTVMLLLTVFVAVNVSALVLRRETVEHDHVRVPTALPVIGAMVSAALVAYSAATADLGVLLRYVGLLLLGPIAYWLQRALAPHTDQLDRDDLA